MRYRCLTLLTDYGYEAGFVGALHAVAFAIAPEVRVIDLDHSVPPQQVLVGALRLERSIAYTPPGVHVAVVDPGVGGRRRAVAIEAGDRVFVGPDNGLLWFAVAAAGGGARGVVLEEEGFWRRDRSRTFDGRDVFVPVAAHLAAGVGLGELGGEMDPADLVRLERPAVRVIDERSARLEVIQVDRFGNVQLSGDPSTVAALALEAGDALEVTSDGGGRVCARYGEMFGDVNPGEAVVLIDSDGCLALSVNCGSAAARLGGAPGTALTLRRST